MTAFQDVDPQQRHEKIVRLPIDDTDFFNIVAEVLQYVLVQYVFIIYLYYVLRTSVDLIKENGFTFKKYKKQMISNGK